MIDISKGRYRDLPWSLVDGCTPCSPGCEHCWSAGIAHRFHRQSERETFETGTDPLTDSSGRYTGRVIARPDRLSIPLKRRKQTVYAVWNDLFHEAVPDHFIGRVLSAAIGEPRHTFLVLTKRPQRMADLVSRFYAECDEKSLRRAINVWNGLTVCNQQEADEKLSIFMQVPGLKWLSIEPMLSQVIIPFEYRKLLCGVVLGGETGPGARPLHPDWVRSVRDQCAAAGVDFFFKSWGDHWRGGIPKEAWKTQGRLLDGKEWNRLPWIKQQ